MPRTITAIYDALAHEKSEQVELTALLPDLDNSQQLLADLDTPSRVARWRLMLWVVAVAMWTHEQLWDLFRAEVDKVASESHVGTLRWYVRQAKRFQYGHELVLNDQEVFDYAVDDADARIVARAAGKDQSGMVLLKVAKMVSGELEALSAPEKEAFEAYISQVKMAGTIVNVLTDGPDLLKVVMNVYYDPLVLNPDGTLILDDLRKPAEETINAMIADLPFNGTLRLTSLVDAVQLAEGVVDPVLVEAFAKHGAFPFTLILSEYVANAGHLKIDPANPLSATITYVPYVA